MENPNLACSTKVRDFVAEATTIQWDAKNEFKIKQSYCFNNLFK
jgi:hypothetical protein